MAVMKKRGGSTLVLIAIVTLLIALFVLVVYPMIAKAYASGKMALKVSAVRDIALILDTMYAYPYDMEIEYNFDLSDFTIKITGTKVEIRDASFGFIGNDPTTAVYSFSPINDNVDIELTRPQKIVFKKENGHITAS